MGAVPGELYYQVASKEWATVSVPNFFIESGKTVRVTVIHNATTVKIFRDGLLVKEVTNFTTLDYSSAEAMVIGDRSGGDFWQGSLGPVLISNGAIPPSGNGSGLVASELAVLKEIW